MARLIHLNGPSGVGKSTLARRWADERPGTLDLDVDQVVPLLGGWRDGFLTAWESARRLALAMAEAHLRDGRDVVLPQLVTRADQAVRFEQAATAAGAGYVEVALLAPPSEQAARFRGKDRVGEVDRRVGELDDTALARIHGHHADYLAARPASLRLDTAGRGPEATYAALVCLLEE